MIKNITLCGLLLFVGSACIAQIKTSEIEVEQRSDTEITAGNLILNNGNIGIGTESPLGQLSLKNQIGESGLKSYPALSTVFGLGMINSYYVQNGDDPGPYPRVLDIASVGSPDGMNGGGIIRFLTNPVTLNAPAVERIRINSNGYVGIGNIFPKSELAIKGRVGIRVDAAPTAPGEALRVEGAIFAEENVVNVTNLSDQDFLVRLSGTGSSVKRTIIGPSVSTRFSLGVGVSSNNEHLTIISGGNVGIGTAQPEHKFDVEGNAEFGSGTSNLELVQNGQTFEIRHHDPYVAWRDISLNPHGGNVGIGTTSPSYTLHVNGSLYYSSGGLGGSDQRWKKDITTITAATETINQINPVSYTWRTDEFPDKNFDERTHYGVIAQELEKVLPEIVSTDNEGYKSVEYNSLIAILIKALQEKDAEINSLNRNVESLSHSNSTLEEMLVSLEARVVQLETTKIITETENPHDVLNK